LLQVKSASSSRRTNSCNIASYSGGAELLKPTDHAPVCGSLKLKPRELFVLEGFDKFNHPELIVFILRAEFIQKNGIFFRRFHQVGLDRCPDPVQFVMIHL
jgi:hypothetical protein